VSGTYEVTAIRYGTRETTKADCFYRYESYGEPDGPLRMDYFFWLLRDERRTVVVDTGFNPGVGERRGRTCLCPPIEALARLGVGAGEVDQVILTHLHYDHTGNVDAFPRAELVVQRRELEFWSGPLGTRPGFGEHAEADEVTRLVSAARSGRVRLLEGSEPVGPGISAIAVGGHSPGQQILAVDGREGPVVLASDALHYYEEIERSRPFTVFSDLEEMYLAFDTLRDLVERTGAALVAGHDPAVLDRFPALEGEQTELGVRVA
jgi:glyoxylase-like metal-dependent hydrolase (beta-lactamase superfamily II)